MRSPHILAIILNWRQPAMTIECVQTLQASDYPDLDILVIDNGSGDGSAGILQRALPDVTVKALGENRGFAGACNWGVRYAGRQGFSWALLLNNDAFVTPDTLSILVQAIEPDIALLSPKIFYDDSPERIWFAGGRQDPRLLEMRDSGQGEIDGPAWTHSRDVDYLVGTCLLVNVAVVSQVGLLDERYFMYYEDLDWSIRLREASYRLRLVADAHLYHRVSRSSGGEGSPLHRYYLARSSVIFFCSHARLGSPWAIFLFRLGSTLKKTAQLWGGGKGETARAYLRGLRDGWRLYNKKKRR